MEKIALSNAEHYIMRQFWDKGTMSHEELTKLVQDKSWKRTTLHSFLSRLAKKGLLKIEKQGQINLFVPIVSLDEYQRSVGSQFLNEQFQGSAKNFFVSMAENKGLTKNDLDEIREWLITMEEEDDR